MFGDSERHTMDATIVERDNKSGINLANINATHGQRGSTEIDQDSNVPSKDSSYRMPVPLFTSVNQSEMDRNERDTREGESCRHSDETNTNDNCCELEKTVDVAFWDSMEGLLIWDMELGVGESVGTKET